MKTRQRLCCTGSAERVSRLLRPHSSRLSCGVGSTGGGTAKDDTELGHDARVALSSPKMPTWCVATATPGSCSTGTAGTTTGGSESHIILAVSEIGEKQICKAS